MCKQVMMFEHRGAVLTSGKSEQGNQWQSELRWIFSTNVGICQEHEDLHCTAAHEL